MKGVTPNTQHASTVMVSYRMKSLKKNDEPTKTPTHPHSHCIRYVKDCGLTFSPSALDGKAEYSVCSLSFRCCSGQTYPPVPLGI